MKTECKSKSVHQVNHMSSDQQSCALGHLTVLHAFLWKGQVSSPWLPISCKRTLLRDSMLSCSFWNMQLHNFSSTWQLSMSHRHTHLMVWMFKALGFWILKFRAQASSHARAQDPQPLLLLIDLNSTLLNHRSPYRIVQLYI